MKSLEYYQMSGKKLYDILHLDTFPLAIKYIRSLDEIPEGVLRPSMTGCKMTLCGAFTRARRNGDSVAMTSDDNVCTPSTVGHGWGDLHPEVFIQSQVKQGWHMDINAERKRSNAIANTLGYESFEKFFENIGGQYCGFVCSPLPSSIVVPDTVMIYCNGVQITHIIHALCYDYEHVPKSSFEGFEESCLKGGLAPFLTQKPQIVIPGAGDRVFSGGTQDHELAISFPGKLLFYVMENIFKTGGAMNPGMPLKLHSLTHITEDITPGYRFAKDEIDKLEKK